MRRPKGGALGSPGWAVGTPNGLAFRRIRSHRLPAHLMVAGAALISALFLAGFDIPGVHLSGIPASIVGFFAFIIKTLVIVFILACIRALFARLRIDQMVAMCLKWLAPIAIVQLLVAVGLKFAGIL